MGVIICKIRPNHPTEVLLIRKRFTYAFSEFVLGLHGRNLPMHRRSRLSHDQEVRCLLEGMTTDELLDVWSLNFEQMWYRIWLNRDKSDFYHKRHVRFQASFMQDGGRALKEKIAGVRCRGVLLWEPPKGKPQGSGEPDISCAMRELKEETGVSKDKYVMIPGARLTRQYTSCGVNYHCTYFVAVATDSLAATDWGAPGELMFRKNMQGIGEAGEIRWLDIAKIRMLDRSVHLCRLVEPAMNLAKKFTKGQWKSPCRCPSSDFLTDDPSLRRHGRRGTPPSP